MAPQDAFRSSSTIKSYKLSRTAELGAGATISSFEPGFLGTTVTRHRAGRLPPGVIIKLYLGGELACKGCRRP